MGVYILYLLYSKTGFFLCLTWREASHLLNQVQRKGGAAASGSLPAHLPPLTFALCGQALCILRPEELSTAPAWPVAVVHSLPCCYGAWAGAVLCAPG